MVLYDMNLTPTASTTAVSCSIATSSLKSLSNDEKPKIFVSKSSYGNISIKRAFSTYKFLWRYWAERVVFINLYWKNVHYEKTGGFCKHKFILSIIKLLKWFIVSQEAAMMPATVIQTCLITIQITQGNDKQSNRKYLLMVAQTVRYLAYQVTLKKDGNEINSNCAQLLLLCENHDPKIEQIYSSIITRDDTKSTHTIIIAIAFNW